MIVSRRHTKDARADRKSTIETSVSSRQWAAKVKEVGTLLPMLENIVIAIGVAVVAKVVPINDPTIILWLRRLFIIANIGAISSCVLIQWRINRECTLDLVNLASTIADHPTAVLADYSKFKSSDDEDTQGGRAEPSTVAFHDKEFLWRLYRIPVRSIIVVVLLHGFLKSTKPLLLQSVLLLKAMWQAQLFKIYILRHAPSGALQRPWVKRPNVVRQLIEFTRSIGDAVSVA